MKPLKHDLLTNKYTQVWQESEDEMKFNAPHYFMVTTFQHNYAPKQEVSLQEIHFQEGPIKEFGVNGVCDEDLIAMVITRLEAFNKTDFRCRENSMAITKLEESLLWLRKRTLAREQRGVEGTHIK
jgi:hypothetical protein